MLAQATTCDKPDYPDHADFMRDEGVTKVAFRIKADGSVRQPFVLNSSGSEDLDNAALVAISKCVFTLSTEDLRWLDLWNEIDYVWTARADFTRMPVARRAAKAAFAERKPAGIYQGSLVFGRSRAEADLAISRQWLALAAELGHPHAQFALGQAYETGAGVAADPVQARAWYEKAAAQGDEFAIQRLAPGAPPLVPAKQ